MKPTKVYFLLLLLATGCAGLQATTDKFDPATGKKVEHTKVYCGTLFDANSSLTKLRVTAGQQGNGSNVWSYPGGTSVGALDQASTSSNLVQIIGDASALGKLFVK